MLGSWAKSWWRTTFGHVTLVAIGFGVATLVVGGVALEVVHEEPGKQFDHRVAAETAALIDEGDDGPNGVAKTIARREAARSTASLDYRLIDATGRGVAGKLDATVPAEPGYVELLPYTRDGQLRIAQSLTRRLPGGHRLLVAAVDEMDATMIRLFAGALGAYCCWGSAPHGSSVRSLDQA